MLLGNASKVQLHFTKRFPVCIIMYRLTCFSHRTDRSSGSRSSTSTYFQCVCSAVLGCCPTASHAACLCRARANCGFGAARWMDRSHLWRRQIEDATDDPGLARGDEIPDAFRPSSDGPGGLGQFPALPGLLTHPAAWPGRASTNLKEVSLTALC